MARLADLGIDFDHWCFACGRTNPFGLHLDFSVARDRATARFTARREHSGFDDTVHGGIVTTLIDEAMGWAIFHKGVWGVTGKLTMTFRRPVPIGEELEVTAAITKETRRAIETHGELRDREGTLLAEGEALFLVMPEARRQELERRYVGSDEAFARIRAAVEAEEAQETRQRENART
jgi:uncharacterized protein (TIGR00369 family)